MDIFLKEIKRARRMFKSMDCDNLRETSQKIIVDTFAPVTSMGETQVQSHSQLSHIKYKEESKQ